MSVQDIISDFVSRVNNAQLAGHTSVVVNKSNLVLDLCKKLTKLKYFESFSEQNTEVELNLNPAVLSKLVRVSKPGRRYYTSSKSFPVILNGFGYNIVTTSKGIFTHIECMKQNIGGEVLLQAIKA